MHRIITRALSILCVIIVAELISGCANVPVVEEDKSTKQAVTKNSGHRGLFKPVELDFANNWVIVKEMKVLNVKKKKVFSRGMVYFLAPRGQKIAKAQVVTQFTPKDKEYRERVVAIWLRGKKGFWLYWNNKKGLINPEPDGGYIEYRECDEPDCVEV